VDNRIKDVKNNHQINNRLGKRTNKTVSMWTLRTGGNPA